MKIEKKKYYNGYEKKCYMHDILKEFFEKYKEISYNKQSIPKRNIEYIYSINDYIEKYNNFRRINGILLRFFDEIESFDDGFKGRYFNIIKSCRLQFNMMYRCKIILKSTSVEQKYLNAIKYCLNDISKRIDFLSEHILPCYIEATPLDNYLKQKGKDAFYEEIIELFPSVDKIDNEKLDIYIHKILSSYNGTNDWQDGLKKYKAFLEKKYEKIKLAKEKENLEQKKKRALETEKVLIEKSNQFYRQYTDGGITYGYNRAVQVVGLKALSLKKQGQKNNKIVFLAKTTKGRAAKAYYLSLETEDNFTNAISKASILEEHESLPSQIQEKVDNYDIVAIEMML